MPLPRSQEFDNLESYPRKFSVDRDEFQFMVKHYPDVDNSLRNCRRRMSDLKVDLVFEDSNSKKAAEEIIKKHLHTIRTRCGTDEVLLSTHVSLFEIDTAVAEFAKAHSLLHIRRRERTQSVIVMGEEITFVKWAKQQLAEKLPPNSCLMNNFKIEHFKYYYLIENLRWNLDMFWPRDVYSVNTTPIDEWMEIEVTSPSRTNGEITESINKCQTSIEEIFRNVHMTVLSDIISASSWFPFLAPVLTQVRVYVRWVPEFSPKMYLMATKRDDVQLIKEYCVFLMEQTKSEQPHQDDDMVGIYGDKITVCLTMGDISIFHCDAILIPFCHQSSQNQVSRKVEKAGGRTYQRLIASSKVDSGGTVYFVPLPALGKLQCKRVYNLCEPDWSTWQPGQHILHDGILPALADCTKHNYKQIAIAPIVSDSMTNSMAVFVKALANAIKALLWGDIGEMKITIVYPKYLDPYEIARFMNADFPLSVLQPSSMPCENAINMTFSNLKKPVNLPVITRSTEQSSRKRQALTTSPLDLSKKCSVVETPSTSAHQQSPSQTQSLSSSTSKHSTTTPKLDELDFNPDGRCQQKWDVINKSDGTLQVTMKLKSGYFCPRNGGVQIKAENCDVVAHFPDTNTGQEVVAKLKFLFTNDQLFKYAYDKRGRLKSKPVIRITKREIAGETEMKHFLHNLKSMLPWHSTNNQDSSATSNQVFPIRSNQGFPTTINQGFPTTSNQGFPRTSNQGFPTTSNQGFPRTSNQGFPTTSNQGFPITSNQGFPTTSNQGFPTTSNQGFPTTSNQGFPTTSNQGFPTTSNQGFPTTSNQGFPTTSQSTQASTNIKQDNKEDDRDKCSVCLADCDDDDDLKTLKCKHTFHKVCIDQALKFSKLCPMCKTPIVKLEGHQPPNGTMTHRIQRYDLPGYLGCGTIEINYNIPGGIQSEIHPNPGVRFTGTQRQAYLPNNAEGQNVLMLLRKAFDARLIFTVGRSLTSGRDNQVTWNDIHHKTSRCHGDTFGYPDATYLARVTADIHALGIN